MRSMNTCSACDKCGYTCEMQFFTRRKRMPKSTKKKPKPKTPKKGY